MLCQPQIGLAAFGGKTLTVSQKENLASKKMAQGQE